MKIEKSSVTFVRLTLQDGQGTIMVDCEWDDWMDAWVICGKFVALHRDQKKFINEWLNKQFKK